MSDKVVYSSDPDWGKPGTPRQPEPVRLAFQGDHRDKLEKILLADGYKVKRVGGA